MRDTSPSLITLTPLEQEVIVKWVNRAIIAHREKKQNLKSINLGFKKGQMTIKYNWQDF